MKKIVFSILALALAAVAFTACQNDDAQKVTYNPNDQTVYGTLTKEAAPTWKTVGDLSLSQMAVIVDQNGVPTAAAEGDQIAAFVGSECRGTAKAFRDARDKWRFNLTVHATAADADLSQLQFTIRYYSTGEGGSYTSAPISYVDDAILGTNTEGYKPKWN